MGRTLAGTVVIVIASAVSFVVQAAEDSPPGRRTPNIVFIAIDTLRCDHLSCYGYSRQTSPNIDRLASEGVLFEKCYSPASWTTPAFMSMFTGLMPSAHGSGGPGGKIPAKMPTVPEQFKKKGYYCGGVISQGCLYGKYGFSRGFDLYDDYTVFMQLEMAAPPGGGPASERNRVIEAEADSADIVTRQAKVILEKAKQSGKPFFLFVHYLDPHDSYVPPPPYDTKFDPGYKGLMNGRGVLKMRNSPPPGRDVENLMARYDGEINYMDVYIGELLKAIDEASDPANTLIVFAADHGEAFAEHGVLLHGNSAYREEVCVPFIWRWPGTFAKGHRVKSPVSTLDMAKTFKEIMGFREFDLLQGESLLSGLEGKDLSGDRAILSEKSLDNGKVPNVYRCNVALTVGDLRLHAWFDRAPGDADVKCELFDVAKDPREQSGIGPLQPALLAQMKASLLKIWAANLEIRGYYYPNGEPPRNPLTDEERRRLETMGYITPGK